jgi:hypothetical protein
MKKLIILLLVLVASTTWAQSTFTTGQRNLNFGNVTVGKNLQRFVQFRLDSSAPAPVTIICTNPRDGQYTILGDSQFTVEKGQFRNLTVEFAPMALGQFIDTLFFTHDGDTTSVKSPSIIRLSGTGVASDTFARMGIQPGFGFIQFGSVSVGNTVQRSFRIQNTTDTTRSLYGTVMTPNAPFTIASGGGSFSLAMEDTMRVFIDFTPSVEGTYFDSVLIISNADSANSVRKVYLSATALKPGSDTIPRITVAGIGGGGVNFGTLQPDASATRYITIRNTSIMNKQVSGMIGTPTQSVFTIDSGNVSFTLDSGASMMVKLRFSPITAGSYRDSLYIVSNALEPNDSVKVVLRGEAVVNSVKADDIVSSISLYPNPARDRVTTRLVLKENAPMVVTVYNSLGREVVHIPEQYLQTGIQDVDFSTITLPNGNYTIRYMFNGAAVHMQMVVER